jgi:Ca-activated chloride channel family protein
MRTGIAAALLASLVALAPGVAFAQKGRAEVNQGNKLYSEGRFEEAHEKYLEALRNAPDSPLIRFNEGNALYQTEEFQRALDAYREAIESGAPDLVSKGWYNLGNALYRQQQLQEALEAYKQSLRADPSDADAKHNLERVLEQLQQQQQQQQQQGGQQGNNNSNKKGKRIVNSRRMWGSRGRKTNDNSRSHGKVR